MNAYEQAKAAFVAAVTDDHNFRTTEPDRLCPCHACAVFFTTVHRAATEAMRAMGATDVRHYS